MVEEPLSDLFTTVSETVTFGFGDILTIPNADLIVFDGVDSPYMIKGLDMQFIFLTTDVIANAIKAKDQFTLTKFGKVFTFALLSDPLADYTGVSLAPVSLVGVANV